MAHGVYVPDVSSPLEKCVKMQHFYFSYNDSIGGGAPSHELPWGHRPMLYSLESSRRADVKL